MCMLFIKNIKKKCVVSINEVFNSVERKIWYYIYSCFILVEFVFIEIIIIFFIF